MDNIGCTEQQGVSLSRDVTSGGHVESGHCVRIGRRKRGGVKGIDISLSNLYTRCLMLGSGITEPVRYWQQVDCAPSLLSSASLVLRPPSGSARLRHGS